ncbi:MAG: cell shape determination protein CcmA [Leptothrix sp. (in: Bacteria)]|nr:cell shape determination protein CcmA [Leptothrix sp. (in: b-proteobacteria)]
MSWFGRKKAPPIRSLICEGTVVQGQLHFIDGLRIDGEVHGDVVNEGDGHSLLVISENGRVHGKVKAGHVIISGEVRGPVHAHELLELQPKARVVGDVRYDLLEMHQGAVVEGELKPLKSFDKPALKLAASNDA